jgi:hypothetical protein
MVFVLHPFVFLAYRIVQLSVESGSFICRLTGDGLDDHDQHSACCKDFHLATSRPSVRWLLVFLSSEELHSRLGGVVVSVIVTGPKVRTRPRRWIFFLISSKVHPLYCGFPSPKTKFRHLSLSLVSSSVCPWFVMLRLTPSIHRFLGLPLLRVPSGSHSKTFSGSLFPGILFTCPDIVAVFLQLLLKCSSAPPWPL